MRRALAHEQVEASDVALRRWRRAIGKSEVMMAGRRGERWVDDEQQDAHAAAVDDGRQIGTRRATGSGAVEERDEVRER